ncbi:MAG: 50S ribosomal protein L4 [Nanoarchaeota archaeon]|nr:50S ribosomal protein L4 [Nanoarchaeota archaeon]
MKLPILSGKNERKGERELPRQFNEEHRPDIITRAVRAVLNKLRQPYGSNPGAGMRHSAKLSRRRRNYRGGYGFGISRDPRKILTRRGRRMYWVGATSPHTRGGRRAHGPKSEKVWEQKINKKEWKKALRSAITASVNKELVATRGHKVPEAYPFIIDSAIEQLQKAKDIMDVFGNLQLENELERASVKKVRAGKGTMRSRKYKKRKGPLVVVGGDCPLAKSAGNIPGVDVVKVHEVRVDQLAPGASSGRLTLWTENAIDVLEKENLFI